MKKIFSKILILNLLFFTLTVFALPEEVSVSLISPSFPVWPSKEFEVKVKVEPNQKGISGGEINLKFDPEVFEVLDVKAGDFFGKDPLVGIKTIDNKEGIIKYALARKGETGAPTQSGIFAILTFKVKNAKVSKSDLTFSKVGLSDENFQDIKEIKTQGATIKISKIPIQYLTIVGALVVILAISFFILKKKKSNKNQ
jgi:hypothetical protein